MNYYESLNIPRDADNSEIKRAYFLAVKLHSPDSDPEGFKIIRNAYETLSDPIKRAKYDTCFEASDDINSVLLTVRELMLHHKYNLAIELLTRVNALKPAVEIKRKLAELLLLIGKSGKAENICQELLMENEADSNTLLLRARIATVRNHLIKAKSYYDDAVNISPQDPKPWVQYFEYAMNYNETLIPDIFRRAMSFSPDMFREQYIFYLIAMHKIKTLLLFEDPLYYYYKFAEYFINDENMTEDVYRATIRLLLHLPDGEAYITFLEKILPTIESSRYRCEEDEEDICEFRAHVDFNKLSTDKRIHKVIIDFTRYVLNEEDNSYIRQCIECYIICNLSELRPSIRLLRKEYPEYFKFNEAFYLDAINEKKEQFLIGKYYPIQKKLLNFFENEIDFDNLDNFDDFKGFSGFDSYSDLNDDMEDNQPFIRETPKVGRNDPCPCGSGKKYKKCCG